MLRIHRFKKKAMVISITIVAIIMVFIVASCVICSPTYVFRILTRFDSSINDYSYFPSRTISKSETPYKYDYNLDAELANLNINYKTFEHKNTTKTLANFVESTGSTSFIIVKDDKIIYEQYANGYNKDSINTSFSMAKSIDSLLIGKAIEDSYIISEDQLITDFIHEFKNTEMEHITIKDLLTMRSDIDYEENGFLWFRDDAYTYWMPDLRKLALNHQTLVDKYNGKMHYNNYHPLLLGIILERSTGMSVSSYFEQSFWGKIGTEYDASWSLDSEKSQFEKMESGINFRSIDFIKFGSMLLHNGYWNGQQLINQDWVQKSTVVSFPINENEYVGTFLEGRNIGYGYMWYSKPSLSGGVDFMAWGKYNQILYVSPANNVVILRTGSKDGDALDLSEVLNYVAVAVTK